MIAEEAKDEIHKWSKKKKNVEFIQRKLHGLGFIYPQSMIEEEIQQTVFARHLIARSSKKTLSLWIKIPLFLFCFWGMWLIPTPLPRLVELPIILGIIFKAWDKT